MNARLLIACLGLMLPTGSAMAQQCRPSMLGSPCNAGSITVLPDPTQPSRALGNPVDRRSGNRHLRETELAPGWPEGLFMRFHNSRDDRSHALGGGWAWSWDTRLHVVAGRRQIVQADGSRWIFEAPDTNGQCGSPAARAGQLMARADGSHLWQWPHGQQILFNPEGRLVSIHQPGQEPIHVLRHTAGPLQGQVQSLHWGDRAVYADHELLPGRPPRLARLAGTGVSIRFTHDWPGTGRWRLISVNDGSGQQRRYEHDPRHQSGQAHAITARHWQLAPWRFDWLTHRMRYDSLGRVLLSEWGGPYHYRRVALRYANPQAEAQVLDCHGCLDTTLQRQRWAAEQGLPLDVLGHGARWAGGWLPATPSGEKRDAKGRLLERHWGTEKTEWRWAEHGLAGIRGPHEHETRLPPDAQGWWRRNLSRPHPSGEPLQWQEAQRFDDAGRLIEERLPEGGQLFYAHDATGALQQIEYRDIGGERQRLWPAPHSQGIRGHETGARRLDASARLVIQANPGTPPDWYAWTAEGSLRGARIAARTVAPLSRNAAGQVERLGAWWFTYDARGRLIEAVRGAQRIQLTHNDWGHTIRRVGVPKGAVHDFWYSGFRRVGELRWGPAGHRIMRRTVWAGQFAVAVLDYPGGRALQSSAGRATLRRAPAPARIAHLHSTAQALPVAATDSQGRRLWLARAHAFGRLRTLELAPGFAVPTQRFPGQNEDPDTGLHDHLLRVFSPEHGEYLQPDPMGPGPLVHPFAYAAHQPHRYADPWGDLLFAFDGTRNNQRTGTHVFELSALYAQEPGFLGPAVHYFPGPGVRSLPVAADPLSWIPVEVDSILTRAWSSLIDSLARQPSRGQTIAIDVIGFSRGAAIGRAFAHRLASETPNGRFMAPRPGGGLIDACLDLRFMGLFDTVAQFGVAGSGNGRHVLDIDPVWSRIAHAVAHHEKRALFPLHSLVGSGLSNVREQGFAGNHIDIGGGYRTEAEGNGDLDDASLTWMWQQGRLVGVPWRDLPAERQGVSEGLLHDERDTWQRQLGNPRPVFDAQGHPLSWAQRNAAAENWPALSQLEEQLLTDMTRPWQHPDIDIVVGRIDEQAYGRWLAALPGSPGASR
jgi:RHS repeat-associated protein